MGVVEAERAGIGGNGSVADRAGETALAPPTTAARPTDSRKRPYHADVRVKRPASNKSRQTSSAELPD